MLGIEKKNDFLLNMNHTDYQNIIFIVQVVPSYAKCAKHTLSVQTAEHKPSVPSIH